MIHSRFDAASLWPALCAWAALSGCGGVAFLPGDSECRGPSCDQECGDGLPACPGSSTCVNGQCTTGGDDAEPQLDDSDSAEPDGGDTVHPDEPDDELPPDDGPECDPDHDGYCDCPDECVAPDCPGGEVDPTMHPDAPEICDYLDNDCDSKIDEALDGSVEVELGLRNSCGGCGGFPLCNDGMNPGTFPGWDGDVWHGGNDGGGSLGGEIPGSIIIDQDGTIIANPGSDGYGDVTLQTGTQATDFAWPGSERHGTMSRVDTVLNQEVGRFASVLLLPNDPRRPYVADYDHTPNTAPRTACQEPSRSTVDEYGNAYIANRAVAGYDGRCDNENNGPNQMGSVSKVAYYSDTLCNGAVNPTLLGCQCYDRNGDGFIQTSHDYDGDGIDKTTCAGACDSVTFDTGAAVGAAASGLACEGDKCGTPCINDASCGVGYVCVFVPSAAPGAHKQRCSTKPNLPEFLGRNDECLVWTRRIPGVDHDTSLFASECIGRDCAYCNEAARAGTQCDDSRCDGNEECQGAPNGGTRCTPDGCSTLRSINDGSLRSVPRAMAVDKQGYIWVGSNARNTAFKLRADGEFVYPADPDATGPLKVNDVCTPTLRRLSNATPVTQGCVGGDCGTSCTSNAQCAALAGNKCASDQSGCTAVCTEDSDCSGAHPGSHCDEANGRCEWDVLGADHCLSQRCYETLPQQCRINVGVSPYGAVIDAGKKHPNHFGYLWLTNTNGTLYRVDTETGAGLAAPTRSGAYGITIDHRDRPWTPDQGSDAIPEIHRLTPDACVGAGCSTTCTSDSQCTGSAHCYYGKCSTALGTWDTFRPSFCIGTECDRSCTSDDDCAGAPAGHQRCSQDPDAANRGCTLTCTTSSDCSPYWGAVCLEGVCRWNAGDCVGPNCGYCDSDNDGTADTNGACSDNRCDTDTQCQTAPSGYRRCTTESVYGQRGCTKECTTQADCAGLTAVCISNRCVGFNWRGRGATTELISDEALCQAQGAPTPPCSRVWAIFNRDWRGSPNMIFAFDADSGHEIIELRRRIDMNADTSALPTVNGATNACLGPVGLGIGSGGKLWAVNQNGFDGSGNRGSMCAYDPTDFSANVDTVEIDSYPYTYSDFTGNIFRSFTNPQGKYKVIVLGCPYGYVVRQWGLLSWEADVPGSGLANEARIEVRVRSAANVVQVQNPFLPQHGPVVQPTATSVDLGAIGVPADPVIELEFKLTAGADGSAPVLHDIQVLRQCVEGGIEG